MMGNLTFITAVVFDNIKEKKMQNTLKRVFTCYHSDLFDQFNLNGTIDDYVINKYTHIRKNSFFFFSQKFFERPSLSEPY